MKNELSWDDIRVFLDIAQFGGLSAAKPSTGLSAATLGRRITNLEEQIGKPLFIRSPKGYQLTQTGEELLLRSKDVKDAMSALNRWQDGTLVKRLVRVSAGNWTASFLSSHISSLWQENEGIGIELVSAIEKVDIGHKSAEIGIRNARPTEKWLAGRKIGAVTYALYSGCEKTNGIAAGLFVGKCGASAETASSRWLDAHHGDRIAVRGNDNMSILEMVVSGAGLSVFPCFVADRDPRLIRLGAIIDELTTEQWIVMHHEERHAPAVRKTANRIIDLIVVNKALFAGELPCHQSR